MINKESDLVGKTVSSEKDLLNEEGSGSLAINSSALDKKGRVYATGKRKTAVARVWLKPNGRGHFVVNGRPCEEVFPGVRAASVLNSPFDGAGRVGLYDFVCTTSGGGLSAQVQAVRHGISKALQEYEPSLRSALKSLGLLTRDARRVERKKPGLRKARRAPQFSKR